MGRSQIEIQPAAGTMAVIDGQQRLTAIWMVLSGEILLFFNLDSEQFEFRPSQNTLRLDLLKNASGDGVRNFNDAKETVFFYHATAAQREHYFLAITKLNNIIHQFQLPSQIIRFADYSTVVDIFRRLNQNGEPLSQAQLAMAGIAKVWPGVFRRTLRRSVTISRTSPISCSRYGQRSTPDSR